LASIGFQGASVKGEGGQQVPAYEIFVGGRYDDGVVQYAKRVVSKIPSKRVPQAVERILSLYQGQRQNDEPFYAFVDRVGLKPIEEVLADLRPVGAVEENLDIYQDWERMGLYKVERGEGECAV
ncbi:MAG: nitrite/sulfite reductase, partial [Dehalococcoidia bacterium]|nr:nitrite/sulfite reductase [Dehalococcoidia bacterium]